MSPSKNKQNNTIATLVPPGPGCYETGSSISKGFSFTRDMRVFDKIAREELKNAIKHKEEKYIADYAKM